MQGATSGNIALMTWLGLRYENAGALMLCDKKEYW